MQWACFTYLSQRDPGAVGGHVDKASSVRVSNLLSLACNVTLLNSPLFMCKCH